MRLSEVKEKLVALDRISFRLPNDTLVPSHFHVTEVGKVTKHFIDCGGTVRNEEVANFQLWNADDYDHRLHPEKLLKIIELSEEVLDMGDLEIEVEYQGETIGKFGLGFEKDSFLLTTKETDCLARNECGVPAEKPKIKISEAAASTSSCTPGSGCC